jgi:hypothetical protein
VARAPRLPNAAQMRRDHLVRTRLTADEHAKMMAKASANGGEAVYIRNLILADQKDS